MEISRVDIGGRTTFSAPLPPSTNKLYYSDRKTNTRHLTKAARDYREHIHEILFICEFRKYCPPPPYELYIHLRFPDARRRDASNQVKLIEDSIFSFLGQDDNLVYSLRVDKYIDREEPGLTVELRHTTRKLEV